MLSRIDLADALQGVGTRPLVPLAAGFVAGIALARILDAGPWWPAIAPAALLLLLRFRHPALLILLGAALGGIRQEVAELRPPEPLREVVEGIVAGPPRVYREGDGWFVVGRVQVRFFKTSVPLIGGERVVVRGPPARPRPPTNPGEFDYRAYLERQGIDVVMTLQELRILEGPPAWSRFRTRLRSFFDRGMSPRLAALQGALVLGCRESLPDKLLLSLQRTGTAHIMAISGQHLAIVAMIAWMALTVMGIHGRPQSLVLLVLLGLYTVLTGPQVSVVRSYAMMAAFFGADFAWRRRDALSALSAAAILVCAFDPAQVADAGFQLSFAAVLGLVMITPIFNALGTPQGWAWNRLRALMGASVAAWLATAPIVLQTFHLLTPGIVLANLVLVPLLSAELIVGLAHLLLVPCGLEGITGPVAEVLFIATQHAASFIASLPFAYRYAPSPGPFLLVLYVAGLSAWTLWCRAKPNRWKPLGVLAVAIPLGLTGLRHRPPEDLLVAALDVGRGSCTYLEWPDGSNLMVDCGSLDNRDAGAAVAAPYLWSRGVTRLDMLILTHPEADHVNGVRSLLDRIQVRRILATREFAGWTWPPGVEVTYLDRRGPPYRAGPVEVLGPPLWEKFGRDASLNETSLVVRADGVLLPGDIEERGVEELLSLPDLHARVLFLPHHGKHFANHEDFIRRVSPAVVVASAPTGYYSGSLTDSLPVIPRITGREGAIEILLPLPYHCRRPVGPDGMTTLR